MSRAAVKFFLWVILSPYICFMFTFLYFLLSSLHLFTSPVQVRNAFYCKTLCRNLPRVFLDVLCSSRGSSPLCLFSLPIVQIHPHCALYLRRQHSLCFLRNPQPWRWQWDGSAGQAITRELMLCGDGGDPGGAELPQDGCVWWCGCSHGTTASAAGWLWWALASMPQAGKTAESSESSWRDEAQCLKCMVKSFSQGCCPQCHCLFVSVTYVNNSGWCEEKVNLLLPFCSRHIFVSTSPPVTVCLPPTLNLPSCISHLFVPTSPSFPAYLSTLTGYGTLTLRTCL